MSLIEGELIEQIEQLDEGWWSGVSADGTKSGLFPGECHLFDIKKRPSNRKDISELRRDH